MRTSKPIATITYNTLEFLNAKLAELMRNRTIQDYVYILHKREEDERKDHIHLYINPNKLIDTMNLQDFLSEPVPGNKPLRPQVFKPCKNIDTWVLYCEHYPPYLASILEERKFVYEYKDFVCADENTWYDMWLHAHKGSDWAHRNSLLEQLRDPNIKALDLILNGSVALNLSTQVAAIERMKMTESIDRMRKGFGEVNRNGRETHSKCESEN